VPRTRKSPTLSPIFAKGITEHTGQEVKPEQVEVVRDPRVSGTYAARVKDFRQGRATETFDCLFIMDQDELTPENISEALEGVEFEQWPPVSGNLQFFI
jgi:hypothetical protein